MAAEILIIDDEIEEASPVAQNIERIFNDFFKEYYNMECGFIYAKTWNDDVQVIEDKIINFDNKDKALTHLKEKNESITSILLDYFFKGQSQQGPSILQDIRSQGYTGPIIFLTVGTDEREATDLIQTKGASGYILKDDLSDEEKIRKILEGIFIQPDRIKAKITRNENQVVLDLLLIDNDISILERPIHLSENKMPTWLYLYLSFMLNRQEISFGDIVNNLDKFLETFDVKKFIKQFIDYSVLLSDEKIKEEDIDKKTIKVIEQLKENLKQNKELHISPKGNWPDMIYDVNKDIKKSLKEQYKGKIIGLFGGKRGRRGSGAPYLLYKILAKTEIMDAKFDFALARMILDLASKIKNPDLKENIVKEISKKSKEITSKKSRLKIKIKA